MGHPIICYLGISNCLRLETCSLTVLPDFTLSAMSLSSKTSLFPYYEMGYLGTYSVLGVGRWADPSSGTSGNGAFEGTMYVDIPSQLDMEQTNMVIVEGYVTMNAVADTRGSFTLRTWQLGMITDQTRRKSTLKPIDLKKHNYWSCTIVPESEDEYYFHLFGCDVEGVPSVHWLGLWSQYSDKNEQGSSSTC